MRCLHDMLQVAEMGALHGKGTKELCASWTCVTCCVASAKYSALVRHQILIIHDGQVRRPGRQRWQLCSSTWPSWGGCWRTLQGCSSAPVCCCPPLTMRRRSSTCSATAMLSTTPSRRKGLRRRRQVLGLLPGRTQTLRTHMKSSAPQVRSDRADRASSHSCHSRAHLATSLSLSALAGMQCHVAGQAVCNVRVI